MSDTEYYFSKSIFGMILMISYRVPATQEAEWCIKYRKATELEAQRFLKELK